jgi:hypothetical protein
VLNAVNRKIRDAAADFGRLDDCPVEFICACGCGEELVITIEEYDAAGGAWIEGHSRSRSPTLSDRAGATAAHPNLKLHEAPRLLHVAGTPVRTRGFAATP